MTAVIVELGRVRNAVDQSARMGMPETRQAVVARIVADAIERHTTGTDIHQLASVQAWAAASRGKGATP